MKVSSLVVGAISAVVVIAVVLLIAGVHFERPMDVQGAALYNPANEITVDGVVRQVSEFACPVSEGEMGTHLLLAVNNSDVQIHLVPGRILRSQKITFLPGDKISITGAVVRYHGINDIIARDVTRGNESFVFRDHSGKLMMTQ